VVFPDRLMVTILKALASSRDLIAACKRKSTGLRLLFFFFI